MSAIKLTTGTKEYALVDVTDRTGALTDLSLLTPLYWLYKPDGTTPVYNGVAALVPASASGTLTSDATNVSNNDTVTINGVVYTFKTALTPAANEVLIGSNAADSLVNLKKAINLESGVGVKYGDGTVVNPDVTITAITSTTLVFHAKVAGTNGNGLTVSEASTHLSWGGLLLTGGTLDTLYPLRVQCLIDTTAGNPTAVALVKGSKYYLYVSWTSGSEVPKVGPVEVVLV